VRHLLPSSMNLPGLTAEEFCTNYVHQLTGAQPAARPHLAD
jgi:hypothetical protein